MSRLTIDIPDYVDLDDHSVQMMPAGKRYDQGKLTLGQAAAFTDTPKETHWSRRFFDYKRGFR